MTDDEASAVARAILNGECIRPNQDVALALWVQGACDRLANAGCVPEADAPPFCVTPAKCRGRGTCPRERACND